MKIAFLIPNHSGGKVGSLEVYYRFANYLAVAGHQVDLYHSMPDEELATPWKRVRAILWAFRQNITKKPVKWFDFHANVRPNFKRRLDGLSLSHERIVAFSWRMIEALKTVHHVGNAFGYVVEYETWAEAEPPRKSRMESAYRSNLPLLASSKAVESMLLEVGAKDVELCVHGVDVEMFAGAAVTTPRDPRRVGFPVRMEPVKSPYVLRETLKILKERLGDQVVLWGFGSPKTPREFTERFDEFHANPSNQELARLYASSAIFAVTSRKEGFGMPAAEAMAAGCAVVSTDNGGIRTFGIDGGNCLIVPPELPEALADAIGMLLDDSDRRNTLSKAAQPSVVNLRWDLAGERFMKALRLGKS